MSRSEHAGVKQLRRLLDAVMVVGSELSLPVVLQRITEAATDLVHARYGALGVLDASGTRLAEFITVGLDAEQVARIGDLPEGHGILGMLIADPRPIRLPDLNEHPDSHGFPPDHPPMTSFLGVPVLLHNTVFGNLYLTDKADDEVFTDVDEELAVALAAAAGLAIENARLHEHLSALSLLEERERIARDLHDDVIQRVFAAGMSLQSTAQLSTQPEVTERLEQTITDLDVTIQQVRNTIFKLHNASTREPSLRATILELCGDAGGTLGFAPVCRIDGPIDTAVPREVAEHLTLVVREALSNIAKHAAASAVDVHVAVDAQRVRLIVTDDGVGIAAGAVGGGNGLTNLADRAARLDGEFAIIPLDSGGTRLTWIAPINAATS